MAMNIVLVNPEIPQNTGNIARTCAATGAALHLIRPLGFELSDRYLKRAGLDYWNLMEYYVYDDLEAFFRVHPGARCHYATTKPPGDTTKQPIRTTIFFFSAVKRADCRKICWKKHTTAVSGSR